MVALQSVTNRFDITVDYEDRKATEWFCVMGECYEYFATKKWKKVVENDHRGSADGMFPRQ